MRTHKSVLLTNYKIEQTVETGVDWYRRKYLHEGAEVMMDNINIVRAIDGSINTDCAVLGSFHDGQHIALTKEQFEWLQSIKL